MQAKRTRKCAVNTCRKPFDPSRSFVNWCSPECGTILALEKKAKQEKKQARLQARQAAEERKSFKKRKEALKTLSDWIQEAEKVRRQRRRLEELAKGEGCISCKRSQAEVIGTDGWKPGGAWDAGHFISKGARANLRMELSNIWLQCKSCNAGSAKYARKAGTVSAAYRINLIEKIGLEGVEALECDHRPRHFTVDQLKLQIAEDKAVIKQIKDRELD